MGGCGGGGGGGGWAGVRGGWGWLDGRDNLELMGFGFLKQSGFIKIY